MLNVPDSIVKKWQDILDLIANILNIPAVLITRMNNDDIEIFVSSNTSANPYHVGDKGNIETAGFYCAKTIKTRQKNAIPNALKDDEWKDNPAIAINMISYLGFPIELPDGNIFGTICAIDNKERIYPILHEDLITNLKDLIEQHLVILYSNQILKEENKLLMNNEWNVKKINSCTCCGKKSKVDGIWLEPDEFLSNLTKLKLKYLICPKCIKK